MTSKTHYFKNAMRVYAAKLICSTGVSGFQTFKPVFCIAGFHSRDQQPCFSTKTKGSVCIIIELNSQRIWSGHQHGRLFFV